MYVYEKGKDLLFKKLLSYLQFFSSCMEIKGVLCGECEDDFGVTLDLQSCTPSSLCVAGLVLFIALCKTNWSSFKTDFYSFCSFSSGFLVVGVSLMILILNVELPNELKGFIFYAQVK